jgi:hypothetical protein
MALSSHHHKQQLANMLRNKSMLLKLENIFVFTGTTHCQCTVPVCLRIASAGGAESIIVSVGSAESMMLLVHAESKDTLSAVWLCYKVVAT